MLKTIVLAAACLGLIAGCSSDESTSSDSTAVATSEVPTTTEAPAITDVPETTEATETTEAPETTEASVPDLTVPQSPPAVVVISQEPGVGTGFEGALIDVTVNECAATDTGWTVNGTVTSPLDVAASYRIYVSMLDEARSTLGLIQIDVNELAPGATSEWAGELAVTGEALDCLLRVERTRL